MFNIAVPDDRRQRVVEERVELEPSLPWDELREPNTLDRFIRVDVAPGPFRIRYLAAVDVIPVEADTQAAEVPITALPVDAFACLRGSRYCESEAVFNLACRLFGQMPPGFTRVDAICRWIRANIDYMIGTSTPSYSARNVIACAPASATISRISPSRFAAPQTSPRDLSPVMRATPSPRPTSTRSSRLFSAGDGSCSTRPTSLRCATWCVSGPAATRRKSPSRPFSGRHDCAA